jgi:hypothetical protein
LLAGPPLLVRGRGGTPEELWRVFWGRRKGDVIWHGDVRIEILHAGHEHGEGLIRHCPFPVPRYLLSGGVAYSWEWLTDVKPCESWRYEAMGKPLWSRATGASRFEALAGGRTRVHFRETYHAFNALARLLLERPVHRFISVDNDKKIKAGVEHGLAAMRKRAAVSLRTVDDVGSDS